MPTSAIRLVTLAACSMVATAVVTSACEAGSRHSKKHQASHHWINPGLRNAWATGEIRQVTPSYGRTTVCPGMGRSFDCAVWPPPYDEDPDRKVSGSDGG